MIPASEKYGQKKFDFGLRLLDDTYVNFVVERICLKEVKVLTFYDCISMLWDIFTIFIVCM